jgi:hypothetical protein
LSSGTYPFVLVPEETCVQKWTVELNRELACNPKRLRSNCVVKVFVVLLPKCVCSFENKHFTSHQAMTNGKLSGFPGGNAAPIRFGMFRCGLEERFDLPAWRLRRG